MLINLVVEADSNLFFLFVSCDGIRFVIYCLPGCYEKHDKKKNEMIEIATRFQSCYTVIPVILQGRFYHFV